MKELETAEECDRKRRKLPRWLLVLWGGFNAGAIYGIIDSMMIIFFGLASFDRTGQIVGFIFWDALGFAVIGSVLAAVVFYGVSRIRRIRPRVMSFTVLVLLLSLSLSLTAANVGWSFQNVRGTPPANPPNMVLITLDTLRADATGAGGNPRVRTPVLDRLARYGRQFCNAVCPVPMTTPSHASMLTATIPAVHGALENRYRLGPDNITAAEVFRENGYRTAAFVSCFPLDRRFGLDQGFMVYDDRFGTPGDLRQASWYKIWKNWREKGRMERNCRFTNSLALPWIRKYTGDTVPFFLWIHYFDPHSPYAPPLIEQRYYRNSIDPKHTEWPDEYAADNARKACMFTDVPPEPGRPEELYLGEVSEMDRAVGEIMHQLSVSGVLENTLVVLLSDHGESFGEHGYFYTHGEDIYEPGLAVHLTLYSSRPPLVPGLDPRLASAVDVATTLLPAAGLTVPDSMEGFDLLSPPSRQAALIENFGIIMNARAKKQRGLRTNQWKMIRYPDSEYHALYDLQEDPGELQNMAPHYPDLSRSFSADVQMGFEDSDRRRRISTEDRSRETLEKLEALGYIVP
ncbi:MAG TPA: sulfatase [bacterium]|nr:sulfatase [bacterium]